MNTNGLAKHYGKLTSMERFRLILAAGGRGDDAERERLARAGGRITLTIQDHAPYAHAFRELSELTFIELVEDAARYWEAFHRNDDADLGDCHGDAPDDTADARPDRTSAVTDTTEEETAAFSAWQRSFDLALAGGFLLRRKTDGWRRFCERLNVPPFLTWEPFPGYDRLQRALSLAAEAAFTPEGMTHWMNRVRPYDRPEITVAEVEALWSPDCLADAWDEAYRVRADWWGAVYCRG